MHTLNGCPKFQKQGGLLGRFGCYYNLVEFTHLANPVADGLAVYAADWIIGESLMAT